MKKVITLFSLLLMAAVQMWAILPTPKVEYVQLYANGPKWATMNLGATSVTDAGLYFWWGDVVGHAKDEAFNFNFDNAAIASYGNNEGYVADGKLVAEKDAATQQLGAGYRMPTQADFEDLYNKCTWTWQSNGYLITGKGDYSGNSIFLPVAGYRFEESITGVDLFGGYYHSTPISNDAYGMSLLYFDSNGIDYDEKIYRFHGFPIRPVYDAQEPATPYEQLVSLVGDKEYEKNNVVLSVNENGELQVDLGQEGITVYSSDDISVNGNQYMLNFPQIKIVLEDGAIAHVYAMNGEDVVFEFIEKAPAAPATPGTVADYYYLASLIGDKAYSYGPFIVYVDKGSIIYSAMGNTSPYTVEGLSISGNEYYLKDPCMKFVVEDGSIAHVYAISSINSEIIFELMESASGDSDLESQLADLIGDDMYEGMGTGIYALEGNVMMLMGGNLNQVVPLSFLGSLTKEGDNYVYHMQGGSNIVFIVEDGEILHVLMTAGDDVVVGSYDKVAPSSTPFAQITIGEDVTEYYFLAKFLRDFQSIEGTATVKLLDDITLSEEWQFENTNADADITLDLNGHNIIGNVYNDGVIYKKDGKLTIEGDGIVENTGDEGDAVGSEGEIVINGGTYIGELDVCFVTSEATIVINGGMFKAPNLYYGDPCINPIVKGGLFSMDPTDCVAEGYEVVENDDEATKAEYPYKVVKKSSTPTAIEGVDADKAQKAIKTIENGKVVIIKNGEKYDLAGRKL